jgi:hypothetical protein
MPNYCGAFVSGGCWFFTINLLERRNALRLRPTACPERVKNGSTAGVVTWPLYLQLRKDRGLLGPQDAEPIIGIVVGHALDEPRQHFLGR